MAKGSHKTWGQAEPRHCSVCSKRVTLDESSWSGTRRNLSRFLLCRAHFGHYSEMWSA